MKVLIRPFEGSDTTSLLELFHGTVHHVNNKDYPPEHLDAWAPPVPDAKKWKDRFKSSETIVAVVNGKVAGFGNLERESSAIGMLYVHKDQLRQGVATALLEKLERMLSKRGLTNASVEASITARPFFEKQGYHLLREHRKMLNGTEFINFIMEKELNLPVSEPVETAQMKDKDKKKKSFSWGALFINKFFDLLMVIIGVTIAFQLNNLKVESDQRSLERFYLESMLHDLDKDIAKCRQNLQDIQSDRKLLTGYLVKLEQTQPPTDSLGIVIVRTVWFETFSGNQDTYSTLLASNGFSTLAEQTIRSQITEYYKQYLSISRFETVYTELVFRMVGYFSPYCDFAKQEIIDPSVVKRVETRNYLLLALGQLKDSDEIYTRMIEKAESLKKNIQLTLQK